MFMVDGPMTVTKIYLCETAMVLTRFTTTQFTHFNQMLLLNRKASLYCNKNNTELIFICEGCRIFFEEEYFENFSFDKLRKCLIEKFLKRSQNILLPNVYAKII